MEVIPRSAILTLKVFGWPFVVMIGTEERDIPRSLEIETDDILDINIWKTVDWESLNTLGI